MKKETKTPKQPQAGEPKAKENKKAQEPKKLTLEEKVAKVLDSSFRGKKVDLEKLAKIQTSLSKVTKEQGEAIHSLITQFELRPSFNNPPKGYAKVKNAILGAINGFKESAKATKEAATKEKTKEKKEAKKSSKTPSKYLYPDDVTNSLDRKKFRAHIRSLDRAYKKAKAAGKNPDEKAYQEEVLKYIA